MAAAISTEVRARNNDFIVKGIYQTHTGLNCFSPVINIMRHPLWGRNQVHKQNKTNPFKEKLQVHKAVCLC